MGHRMSVIAHLVPLVSCMLGSCDTGTLSAGVFTPKGTNTKDTKKFPKGLFRAILPLVSIFPMAAPTKPLPPQ